MTFDEWTVEGIRRFGPNREAWRFVCPCCKYEQTVAECRHAGQPVNAIGFSCIGRWTGAQREALGGKGPGPCNYAGGGLFRLNPIRVLDPEGIAHELFAFAEPPA
jgi:hypothetical protein